MVPWRSLNGRHKDTAMCRSGAEWKRRRDTEAEIRESTERAFEAYGYQLESVTRFTYMGRVMTAGDDDWPAVAGNLAKARRSWGRLRRILGRKGGSDGADIGGFLQGHGATSLIIWGRDMGSNPKDGKGAKRIYLRGG